MEILVLICTSLIVCGMGPFVRIYCLCVSNDLFIAFDQFYIGLLFFFIIRIYLYIQVTDASFLVM